MSICKGWTRSWKRALEEILRLRPQEPICPLSSRPSHIASRPPFNGFVEAESLGVSLDMFGLQQITELGHTLEDTEVQHKFKIHPPRSLEYRSWVNVVLSRF